MGSIRRTVLLGLAGMAAVFAAEPVAAQNFPTREIRVIVPWNAGGSNDIMARFLQPLLEKKGIRFVVENVPGGTGAVGLGQVATARPDGYTLGLGTSSTLAIIAQGKAPLKNEQFTHLVRFSEDPLILLVSGKSGHKTLNDFVAHLKANPGKVTIGTPGANNINHIMAAMTARGAGVDYRHVPYPGGSRVVAEIMGGQVEAGTLKPSETMQQIQSGDLRPLGAYADKRLDVLPNIPTLSEAGINIYAYGPITQMSYLVGPANMPAAVKAKLIEAFRSAVTGPEFQEFAKKNGFLVDGLSGDALETTVRQVGGALGEVAKQVFKD
jgi:tripartite-type tricarboxylate transporter receptor subunit TctC